MELDVCQGLVNIAHLVGNKSSQRIVGTQSLYDVQNDLLLSCDSSGGLEDHGKIANEVLDQQGFYSDSLVESHFGQQTHYSNKTCYNIRMLLDILICLLKQLNENRWNCGRLH